MCGKIEWPFGFGSVIDDSPAAKMKNNRQRERFRSRKGQVEAPYVLHCRIWLGRDECGDAQFGAEIVGKGIVIGADSSAGQVRA